VTPTPTHHAMVKLALQGGCHVFVEKPLTRTLEEAKELIELSRKTGKMVQVGHVERFNPALLALGDLTVKPYFIEAHRLAMFNPRGVDVSVVLDLMIHDVRLFEMDAKLPEDGQQFPLETPKGPRIIHVDQPDSGPVNAIQLELESLADSIMQGKPTAVTIEDGYRALDLAHRITAAVEANRKKLPDPTV